MACLAETTTQYLAPERDNLSESVFKRKLRPGFDLQTGMSFPVEASSGKRIPYSPMAPQRISCPRGRLRRSSNDVIAGYIMGSYNVRLFDNPRPVAEHGSPIKAAVAEASLPKIHLLNLAPVGRIKSTAAQVVKSWAAPLLSLRGQCLNGVDPSFYASNAA